MAFVAKANDILNMKNNKKYFVVETFEFEENPYLALIQIPKNVLDVIPEIDKSNYIFAREIVRGEDYFIDEIKDSALIKELKMHMKLS